jgi:hypothetical protein
MDQAKLSSPDRCQSQTPWGPNQTVLSTKVSSPQVSSPRRVCFMSVESGFCLFAMAAYLLLPHYPVLQTGRKET